MDPNQLKEYIIIPSLNHIGLYSLIAEKLLLATAIVESGLRYIDQTTPGPGPAYGFFQMEKATHDDLWKNYIDYDKDLSSKINEILAPLPDKHLQLRSNLYYASIMCRVHYRRKKDPLPNDNIIEIGKYWKKHYNTYLGKGSVEKFVSVVQPVFDKIYP